LKLKVFLLLSFLIFLLNAYSLPLNATIRYVSKTGNSTPPYISWETAADSIQKCINISDFGDTIYVANGVYEEQVVMIPGLSLIGAGTDSCIVDSRSFPPQGLHTIEIADSCLIKGFYIRTSNNFNYGYGIYTIGQNGLVTENKFSNANTGIMLLSSNIEAYKNYCFNVRTGITAANSSSIVRKNDIFKLTDIYSGSGIFIDAIFSNYRPTIDSNYIATKNRGIDKDLNAKPTIKNNVIEFIQYGGPAIYLGSSDSAKVFNNLMIRSRLENHGVQNLQAINNYITGFAAVGMQLDGGNNLIKNNVVTKTVSGIIAVEPQSLIFQYNNVWNNENNYTGFTADTTNISVDPMIVNDDTTQGKLDFHLQMFSPLIDAGDPNILDKDSTRSDIGLYGGPYGESYIYVDLPPRPPVNFTAEVDSGSSFVILTWNRNTEADTAYYNVYRDSTINFPIDPSKLISSQTDTLLFDQIPTGYRRVVYKITAVDQQDNESLPSEEQVINIVGIDREPKVVRNYILYQNYPNPFNPSTKIGYKLKERGYVKLYVYDVKGELVSVLVNQVQEAGYYEVDFSVGQESIPVLSSGVYIYQIMVKGENNIPVFSDIKKMVYIK
jgi:hypothetical protein